MRGLTLAIALLACLGISGCGESCDYVVLSEAKSPDGKLKAVVFQRGCGTAIDSSTHVSIVKSEVQSLHLGRGNLFIAGDDRRGAAAHEKPPTDIKATWGSNSSLTISYPKGTQVLLRNAGAAGVAVKYDFRP